MFRESHGAGELSTSWARRLVCSRSGETAPLERPAFLSSAGAPWLVEYDLRRAAGARWAKGLAGRPWTLWRYRELLPLAHFEKRIDLGEGGTPLLCLRRMVPEVECWIKEESRNPTGSFKARGLSLAVNRARELGAPGVQLPSAGNAAIALAAYAAAAGLPARVALPADTPRGVFERCRAFGAEILTSAGTLVDAARALARFDDGFFDLSTLREPYRVEGKKTMGFELAEQGGWELPDWIVYPTGGGTGIVGMHKAFAELRALGLLRPGGGRLVAVQMEGCAPIVRAFDEGLESAPPWRDARTRVWGLRVPRAIGDFLILRALRESDGAAVAVSEEEVTEVASETARKEGLRIGPEGAATLAGLRRLVRQGRVAAGARVVVFQTGDPANYS